MILFTEFEVGACWSSPPHSWGLYDPNDYKKLPIEWEWYNQVPEGKLSFREYEQKREDYTNELIEKWRDKITNFKDKGKMARLVEEFTSSDFSTEEEELVHSLVFSLLEKDFHPECWNGSKRHCFIIEFSADEDLEQYKELILEYMTDTKFKWISFGLEKQGNITQICWHYPNDNHKGEEDDGYNVVGEFFCRTTIKDRKILKY